MRVFVGSADIANNTKTVVDAPHKPIRVEAFRKQKIMEKKMPIKVTSKKFFNKEVEKIMEQGLQDVQKYYKVPNVSHSIKTLRIYLKATVAYVDKQLELINQLLDYKIARLPKDIRPYVELHYQKAVDGKPPVSVADNPKNFFREFHH